MSSLGDFEDDWEPLSEAEMKVAQAKQERSNKISKLMGDYLLKGYKMLASSCEECGCILLQDKQSNNYCVACSELEAEGSKDDPAVSQVAALSKIREGIVPQQQLGAGCITEAGSSGDSHQRNAVTSFKISKPNPTSTTTYNSSPNRQRSIPSLMNSGMLNGHGPASALNGAVIKGKQSSALAVQDVGRDAYEAFASYEEVRQDDLKPSHILPETMTKTPSEFPRREHSPIGKASNAGHPSANGGPIYNGVNGISRLSAVDSEPSASSKLSSSEFEHLSGSLKRKLISTGQQLEASTSFETDKLLCVMIKNYAEALEAVNKMQTSML